MSQAWTDFRWGLSLVLIRWAINIAPKDKDLGYLLAALKAWLETQEGKS